MPITQEEAQALVIARLKSRSGGAARAIALSPGGERSFGWIFEVSVDGATADPSLKIPRRVIVNKHSQQVVASSVDYEVEQFVRRYEKLLAQNQARSEGWCGTLPPAWPWKLWRKKSVAERAMDGGFYEIGAKEGEP